jgi:hypothetical protein
MARKDCRARGTGNLQTAQRESCFAMPGQTKDQAKQELMLDTKKRRAKYSKKSTFVGPLQVNFRCAVVVMQVPSEESDVVSSGESIDSMSWLIARG